MSTGTSLTGGPGRLYEFGLSDASPRKRLLFAQALTEFFGENKANEKIGSSAAAAASPTLVST